MSATATKALPGARRRISEPRQRGWALS
jgi:hypothetical protein